MMDVDGTNLPVDNVSLDTVDMVGRGEDNT